MAIFEIVNILHFTINQILRLKNGTFLGVNSV